MIIEVCSIINSPSVIWLVAGVIPNCLWLHPVRRFHFNGSTGDQKTSSNGKCVVNKLMIDFSFWYKKIVSYLVCLLKVHNPTEVKVFRILCPNRTEQPTCQIWLPCSHISIVLYLASASYWNFAFPIYCCYSVIISFWYRARCTHIWSPSRVDRFLLEKE